MGLKRILSPFIPAQAGIQTIKHWAPRFRGGERKVIQFYWIEF
jgi:hypothetical protein